MKIGIIADTYDCLDSLKKAVDIFPIITFPHSNEICKKFIFQVI